MKIMEQQIQTSTPIVHEKLLPPPPRRLWGEDSVTEQLYRNKWAKYRNSIEEKERSWNGLDAPCYVDFEDIPDVRDSYFDHADEEMFMTPQKTLTKPLPGMEDNNNNNNILDCLKRCSLSAVKKPEQNKQDDEIKNTRQLGGAVNLLLDFSESLNKSNLTTIENNNVDEVVAKVPEAPDLRASNNNIEKQHNGNSKSEKKNQTESRHCTITEPFSFEIREKCRQEHKQARRDRDSAGREMFKGFRANPVPNFLKLREKKSEPATSKVQKKNPSHIEMLKLSNAAEVWKKKAFQPSLPKKVPVMPKAPELLTAARAKERQRFEEQLREKERQKQAIREMEEAARKKAEEEEIAKLRKELVHKAQPIRRYKIVVPRVEKRQLNEPTTPINCKRRRKM